MSANTRNLLAFLALSCAAFLTWLLAREPVFTSSKPPGSSPAPLGYYLTGAMLYNTDDEGHVAYRVMAQRVDQEADADRLILEKMSIEYAPELDLHWDISASRGIAVGNTAVLDLEGVRLVYTRAPRQEASVFETSALHLDTEALVAKTDQLFKLRDPRGEITGEGLEIDLQADTWNAPHVSGRYQAD